MLANFVSQISVALLGIVMVPFYVLYMGVEAYGLVGFFSVLSGWFQLLDMGIIPTATREVARFKGGVVPALDLARIIRAMEFFFWSIALVAGGSLFLMSGIVADSWLGDTNISFQEVSDAVSIMAVVVALRWAGGLYRGIIVGFERLVWLSTFNLAVAVVRFVVVIPFFELVGTKPSDFFAFQLVLAFVEIVILVWFAYRLLPGDLHVVRPKWNSVRSVAGFSMKMAFLGSIWSMVSQADKLVLSKMLSLTEYAYFSLAVLVAGGVIILTVPISSALLPRLARLHAERSEEQLIDIYRASTQMIAVVAVPVVFILAFFAEQILYAWTGDLQIVHASKQILALYALGNGVFALAAFPYYLQYAKGDVRLHMISSVVFLVVLVPCLVFGAWSGGGVGSGYVWLFANLLYFIVWVPVVHGRFAAGLHVKWLWVDVMPIVATSCVAAWLVTSAASHAASRIEQAISITVSWLIATAGAAAGSTVVRRRVLSFLFSR